MEAKDLISQLVLGQISVSQALQLSLLHYGNSFSEVSKQWISNELHGYKGTTDLPDYRLLDCDLKIEIYGPYSNFQIQTLDTSGIYSFLKEGGLEETTPNKMRLTQNIESIEKTEHHTDGTIKMHLDDNMKNMVLEFFKYPSYARFGRLFQECPASYINVVLSQVKNKLVDLLQKEVLPKTLSATPQPSQSARKKIFISYSWEDDAHNGWVHQLAKRLNDEFDVRIDMKLPLGADINAFMERMVTEADRVLLVLTPTYKQKADSRAKGVGYEAALISDEIYANQDTTKFAPILRLGTKEGSFPKYLGNRKGLNMVNDSDFEENLQQLIEDLRTN